MNVLPNESEIKTFFSELLDLCKVAELESSKTESTVNIVNEFSVKLRSGHKLSASNTCSLKSHSKKLLDDSVILLKYYREILEKIQDVRCLEEASKLQGTTFIRRGVLMSILQENARTLPLWVGTPEERLPALCGSLPTDADAQLSIGTKLAALVLSSGNNTSGASSNKRMKHSTNSSKKGTARVEVEDDEDDDDEETESWILAEVVSYDVDENNYVVEDIDIEEGKQQYTLAPGKIIPLPKWKTDPLLYPEALFKKGTAVLGLYPQTTCFYKAIVREFPMHAHDDYSLFFEDPSYPEGFAPALKIPQKYVITVHNTLGRIQ